MINFAAISSASDISSVVMDELYYKVRAGENIVALIPSEYTEYISGCFGPEYQRQCVPIKTTNKMLLSTISNKICEKAGFGKTKAHTFQTISTDYFENYIVHHLVDENLSVRSILNIELHEDDFYIEIYYIKEIYCQK